MDHVTIFPKQDLNSFTFKPYTLFCNYIHLFSLSLRNVCTFLIYVVDYKLESMLCLTIRSTEFTQNFIDQQIFQTVLLVY